jgi:transcription elongation factor GreA
MCILPQLPWPAGRGIFVLRSRQPVDPTPNRPETRAPLSGGVADRARFPFFLDTFMAKIPLTIHGAELLRNELHRLKTVERPAVIQAIAEARAQGDLSENAEYDAAKERQGFIEGRIGELEGKLGNAQIIDPTLLDAEGRCVFGATVDLEDLASGEKLTYQIVGEDEADLKLGKISVVSPLGRSLIGRSAGDTAEVLAPGGKREYEIIDVRYV